MLPRRIEIAVQFLIVLSMLAFAIETLPGLSPTWQVTLYLVEIASVMLFTVEYFWRLAVSKDKRRFATSFFGIIDLIAILPFYLSIGLDLRSVRVFRIFRLIRLLNLRGTTEPLSDSAWQ